MAALPGAERPGVGAPTAVARNLAHPIPHNQVLVLDRKPDGTSVVSHSVLLSAKALPATPGADFVWDVETDNDGNQMFFVNPPEYAADTFEGQLSDPDDLFQQVVHLDGAGNLYVAKLRLEMEIHLARLSGPSSPAKTKPAPVVHDGPDPTEGVRRARRVHPIRSVRSGPSSTIRSDSARAGPDEPDRRPQMDVLRDGGVLGRPTSMEPFPRAV